MKVYKAGNGRLIARRGNGRFFRPDLRDLGFDVADGQRKCKPCGEVWQPILVTGKCPKCGAQDSEPVTP